MCIVRAGERRNGSVRPFSAGSFGRYRYMVKSVHRKTKHRRKLVNLMHQLAATTTSEHTSHSTNWDFYLQFCLSLVLSPSLSSPTHPHRMINWQKSTNIQMLIRDSVIVSARQINQWPVHISIWIALVCTAAAAAMHRNCERTHM